METPETPAKNPEIPVIKVEPPAIVEAEYICSDQL
jgi:hypothetical protein